MTRAFLLFFAAVTITCAAPSPEHFMRFNQLADRWDEAVPLGNGMIGALVWQEGDVIRFSLDRTDLWDDRPVENFQKPEFRFDWMLEQVEKGDIKPVQDLIGRPYSKDPAPTKIPAARIEWNQTQLGHVESVILDINRAVCTVRWDSGTVLECFVHATKPIGWFRFSNLKTKLEPKLIPPPFGGETGDLSQVNSLNTPPLSALGYPEPDMQIDRQSISYVQQGWGDFTFAVHCTWHQSGDELTGVWSVTSNRDDMNPKTSAIENARSAMQRSYILDREQHTEWWQNYWNRSGITIPDDVLEKQWYLEQYKFASATRRGAPPITLQAVWTADEQRIPPWKGDYHHDLNTQLSYWLCYSSNHLDEGLAFLDWLWDVKPNNEAFTRAFYGHGGLNVPGTTTLDGDAMGGWQQYSLSPTTSAWLAHHFYLHWRYSMDREFLRQRGYPYIKAVAEFLENHSVVKNGVRQLPLSSSPEINDNRIEAWFRTMTNYDLALIRWLYGAAVQMANSLGQDEEAKHWQSVLDQFPQLARSKQDGRLLVAPGTPLHASHRHYSHLMAFHPLGLVDIHNGKIDAQTIKHSLDRLEELGPEWWCGYSYAWVGGMYARARQADSAARALRTFAECFTSINSFHLNGDQSKTGKSNFQYRPFTLEGNFAFAAGVQEMLLQSHSGTVVVFPAVPKDWLSVSFQTLRAEGAFLISAQKENGIITGIDVLSEAGETLQIQIPNSDDGTYEFHGINSNRIQYDEDVAVVDTEKGDTFSIRFRSSK